MKNKAKIPMCHHQKLACHQRMKMPRAGVGDEETVQ